MFPLPLDVVYTKEGTIISVKTRAFPGCMGIGLTEAEAFDDLKRSIKICLKEGVESAVEDMFSMPHEEQIHFDASASSKRVVFNAPDSPDQSGKPHKKRLSIQFPVSMVDSWPIDSWSDLDVQVRQTPPASAPRGIMQKLGLGYDLNAVHPSTVPFLAAHSDALIMGIPLNLN